MKTKTEKSVVLYDFESKNNINDTVKKNGEKNKYCNVLKVLLKNYNKMKKQIQIFETVLMQSGLSICEEGATIEQIARQIAEQISKQNVQMAKDATKLTVAYLKSKYILHILDDALNELQTFENGPIQRAVLEEIYINDTLRDDIEIVLEERGFPLSRATAYRILASALENLSVLIWGYEAIKCQETEELFSQEFLTLLDTLAA